MIEIAGVKFYNIEETARLLGITPRTLQRWTNCHDEGSERPKHIKGLRPVHAPNGKKLFKEADILKAVSACFEMEVSAASLPEIGKI
ncbi:MAG TPA: hypothetical protein VMA75_00875 [Candidatus Paceibacterota bacterium]|nr:hypothetical protein [Candidatus Paceibacterota bacterium]